MSVATEYALETFNLRVTNKKLTLLNEQKEHENIEVHLKNLQTQINPHFLFNCLTNLYASIDENESAQLFCKKVISYVPAYARTKGGSAVRSRK